MLLSKSSIYGIRSVLLLALENNRQFISTRELSERLGISFHYLTKILQTLNHAKILESTKGPKGGISFRIPPEKITVYDIIYAIDSDDLFNECVLGLPGCSDLNPCSLHEKWAATKTALQNDLKEDTIKDMAIKIREKKIRLFDEIR